MSGIGLSTDQIMELLYKKLLLNISDTNPGGNYLIEPIRQNFINTQYTNIFSQVIPVPAPASNDLILMVQSNGYSKYRSSNYPYISYYSTIQLVPATYCNTISFSSPLLSNIITSAYHITYSYNIFSSDLINIKNTIYLNQYYLDPDIGTLTFFNTGNNFNNGNPPLLSFYKYEGQKGDSQFLNIQQL